MYVLLKTRKAYGVKTEDQGIKQDIYIYIYVCSFFPLIQEWLVGSFLAA